jgi:Fur family ferric uptake transcriptional regulator
MDARKLAAKFPEVYKILNDFMMDKNMRKTGERYYLILKIYEQKDHFDAEKLYKVIQKEERNISLATVYNSLELFLECGLVIKHNFGQNLSLYEKSYGHKQHDHFICKKCKQITEFCDPRLYQIKKSLEEILNVKVDSHSLYLYGFCSNPKCKTVSPT